MISELGFVYFFERIEARNAVMVLFRQPCFQPQDNLSLTSRACATAEALPALMHATAREKRARVCVYIQIRTELRTTSNFSLVPADAASRPDSNPAGSVAM